MVKKDQSPLTATYPVCEVPNEQSFGERRSESVANSFDVTSDSHNYEILLASGPDSARLIPLTGRQQTLGRSTTCGIRIDDPSLETHHVMISGPPSNPSIQPLGGSAEIGDSTFRVGSTTCWVQPAVTPLLTDRPTLATKQFHRSPQSPDSTLDPPIEPKDPPQPTGSASPPWGPIGGGVATGLLVAAITGQLLFGIFSLVTASIAGLTWLIQRHGHRRALRRWTLHRDREREAFDRQCVQYARYLATNRRQRHRTLGELFLAAHTGDDALWSKRSITDVCIGFGSRQVTVVPGALPLAFNDIPVTADFTAGSIIGVHGPRSIVVSTAILLRLTLEVGPSDWRLLPAESLPQSWKHLESIPHLRNSPLVREDLGHKENDLVHNVVLVTDSQLLSHRQALPLRYIENHRASLIVCAPTQRDLPASCTTIIDSTDIELDGVSPEGTQNIIAALAQWHDPDARTLSLPQLVKLHDLPDLRNINPQVLRQRWSSAANTLRIDVGLTSDGPLTFDIAADGPHMIVVGTTGSGKSELLRSLVISMSLNTSPTKLNFILIDYKGGAAFDACVRLPHVVGVITDLDHEDGNEQSITRALRGLEAELRRREAVLRKLSCGNQDEYQHRRTSSDEPMSRLVIVVDELAALRAEVPEVVSALMAISQRGRSLGLHLIVATQRPGSELTPDVLANAPIRLALRLQTREDSMQVIGHPGAADLLRHRPGRALLRLGGQAPEEFHSLYIADELGDLVAMADSVARDMGLPQPRSPWCEPLAAHLAPPANREPFSVGLVDDPDTQSQFPLRWNPQRHLLVMTGTHCGKTWSLYTLSAVSQIDDSEACHLYISGRGDHDLGSSWVAVTDRERLQRTLNYLGKVIKERRIQQGDYERITVFIDDVDLWRSQHTDDRLGTLQWETFERVVVEGPSVGVACVFTATHDHSLSALIKSRIDQRWLPGHRPGSFEVILPYSSSRLSAQLFDPKFFNENLEILTPASALQGGGSLTTLPTVLKSPRRVSPGSFGQHADDLREVCLDSRRELKSLILGPRGSGRTTVLTTLVEAWKDLHPTGVISSTENPLCDSLDPVLVVIDDADRRVLAPVLLNQVMKSLTLNSSLDGDSSQSVSIMATASPHALRTQADHWLQALRRYRTGVLLGRCAEEDGDLLGHYARHLSFVPPAVSRGLWIEDGESQGVVQFYDHS